MASIEEIKAATGLSRATIYRRRKAGETDYQIMGVDPDAVPEPAPPEMAAAEVTTKEWCEAVIWAVQHAQTKNMTQRKAGSLLRFSLWQSAVDNPKDMICRMMPDALKRLDQMRKEEMEGDTSEVEKADIAELEELLVAAIEESGV